MTDTGAKRKRSSVSGAARLAFGVLALALLALPGTQASAAPDRSATLNGANPRYTWEGSGSGVADPSGFLMPAPALRCTEAPFECDYVLLDVEDAGELTVTLDITGVPVVPVRDLDAYVYKSNAAGDPIGRSLTNDCVTGNQRETCRVEVQPGFYVVEVEYFTAVAASYIGSAELAPAVPAPPPPSTVEQTITADDCKFTLYYFKDSAERLQASVPPGYRLRPYPSSSALVAEGSATIAAAAYDCDRIDMPGSTPGPGIFTVLSVVVYPASGAFESPATADFYVLWIHANNPHLVDLLASRGMPAHHVPEMRFDRPALSLAVNVDVPWSPSPYELATNGYHQDLFHPHENSFVHVAADGRPVRMDFITQRARDHFCFQVSDGHDVPCGELKAHAGTPVADFFGGAERTAHNAWDHDPVPRSWFVLR